MLMSTAKIPIDKIQEVELSMDERAQSSQRLGICELNLGNNDDGADESNTIFEE